MTPKGLLLLYIKESFKYGQMWEEQRIGGGVIVASLDLVHSTNKASLVGTGAATGGKEDNQGILQQLL